MFFPIRIALDVDFAQLVKLFGDYGQFDTPEARYFPPRIAEVISKVRSGDLLFAWLDSHTK
jgi:hypothetical protein